METPLYVACQNKPPLPLIEALLEAWPDGAITKSRQGDLPLHILCRYMTSNENNVDLVASLVRDHPGTACQRTRWGATPVTAVWERHDRRDTYLADKSVMTATKLSAFTSNGGVWQVTQVLLEAIARYRRQESQSQTQNCLARSEDDMLYVAHAAVSLGSPSCPLLVLFGVVLNYSEQFAMRDEQNRLPLHIAVGSDNLKSQWKFKRKEYWAIRLCLELYPPSVTMIDPNEPLGRYPLHTALSSGHEWENGVRELVRSAPQILRIPDPVFGLYPFQMVAALHSKVDDTNMRLSLNTAYQLLRSDPTVLTQLRIELTPPSMLKNKYDCSRSGPATIGRWNLWG